VCLRPWDDFDRVCEGSSSSSSSTSSEPGLQCSASTASSVHSCHDDGLISSCDPAATDFLLFASRKATAAVAGPFAGTSCLTRTFAGALDTMLSADCACTEGHGQHDTAHKQPHKRSPVSCTNLQEQLQDSAHH
jgi:hypothetical protein